ncbi:MAG: aldose 1-epimerase [Deinococcus sp.]
MERLHNAFITLEVLPELGASVLNLTAASGRPVLRPVQPADVKTSSQCASFSLLPYSNRIRGASFPFEGQEVGLKPNTPEGNVQHGDVRNRPWRLEGVSETHLAATFDSRDFADINWPWAFTAQVEYRLSGEHLDTSLTLTNASGRPMPAGMGLHPYFHFLQDGPQPSLGFVAGGLYATDASLLPMAQAAPIPAGLDFSSPRPLGGAQLNHVYASWDGVARLAWPERALVVTADALFSHLVVFTAPDGSLALEPVSHATDAFNLAARGVHGSDMRVLLPGQSLGGAVRFTLEGRW